MRPMSNVLSAMDIARYFLSLQDEDEGDTISNLKLQKLLYYAQGYHLALFDKPLFPEAIVRWQHGPVVADVYHIFKEFGNGALPCPHDFDADIFDEATQDFLDEIYRVFGQYSAWKLSKMTHEEAPWKEAQPAETITHQALKEFFKTQLTDAA
jgi:uncharacterized phage-associated protein